MAFKDKSGNTKQHLNLSLPAYEVVENDRFSFGEKKRSTFLNRVFEYYHLKAEASISLTINNLEEEISQDFSEIIGDEATKQKIIKKLISKRKDILLKKANSYEKGKGFKFWLDKENMKYLTETYSECEENEFYSNRGQYIKCVIEEYTRLPYVQRELVYFTPFVSLIEEAISKEKQLQVTTENGKVFNVYPYKILSDPLSTTNYLVGYSKPYEFPNSEKQPCSFKIAALKSIKLKSKSAFMKASDKKQLIQKLNSRGVQFMIGNETEIQVKLTEIGVKKYRRYIRLRPVVLEKRADNLFVFNCTTAQAEFYFFKFGKEAEIISPLELREHFVLLYQEASNLYLK